MTSRLWRTPDVATDSWVITVMKVLGVLFGLTALRSLTSATLKLKPLFEGVFAPQTMRFGALLALTILFSLAFLYAALLLFKSRIAGIRWTFVCLGHEAALWVTGKFGATDVIWVLCAAGALWWCTERIANQT